MKKFIAAFLLIFSAFFILAAREMPSESALSRRNFPTGVAVLDPLGVTFSHEAGFYDRAFSLTLSAPAGARIFYTTDGSYPTASSTRYITPIRVRIPSRTEILSIRAIAVRGDEVSEIATRNFFIGDDVFARFCENTLIFALASDPHGLFDHYDGIFVPGIDRERWRAEYAEQHGRLPEIGYEPHMENPGVPANFNRSGRESERPVHVEMFDNTGALHISQRAGFRVRGGFSRAHEPQKSVELFAREEYGDRNNFRFAFFDDEFTYDGQLIDRYRRVRLRNGGSDRYAGFIRDELSQSLFRQAGLTTTQTHRPAAVFLNGEYYGVAWLKSPRTGNHLARIFGGDSDNFEIVEGGDRRFEPGWWYGEDRARRDMREVSELAMAGFTGEGGAERFEEFSRRVCAEDLMLYFAMQIVINNYDWPNHNMEFWRYFPTEDEPADLHPYLRDGRWRIFAHDLEAGWAIWDDYDIMAREDTLRDILTGENYRRWNSAYSSAFLYAFVNYEPTRLRLAEIFEELIEGIFAPENVIRTLDDLIAQIENEHNHALAANTFRPHNPHWPSAESVTSSRQAIRRFAQARPAAIRDSVRRNL
ncbi:MAG: CotH kinase family protein [Defluviitaleaceae bacterium]|nr:CotH kinase family protein [Defluviitaleaceae bacterium]